ncbi:hypothetical protein ACROYT_G036348 [Oculina patagonica]
MMDPVNGDAELAVEGNVDHAEDITSPASGEEEDIIRSPSYWEEVDQEEIERERRVKFSPCGTFCKVYRAPLITDQERE